jgi:rhamnosyltransferase subunit B
VSSSDTPSEASNRSDASLLPLPSAPFTVPSLRIVVATFGSLGDLHPLLALAIELRQRGHIVTIATSPHYAERVTTLGFAFEPIGPPISPEDPVLLNRLMRTARGPEYFVRKLLFPHLPRLYTELGRITAGADLLIASEVVFVAPILAEKTAIPWVSALFSPISFLSAYDASLLPPMARMRILHRLPPLVHRLLHKGLALALDRWSEPLQVLRKQLGLPRAKAPILRGKMGAGLVLAMFSKHFATGQPDWPSQTKQTGFAYFRQGASQPIIEHHRLTRERIDKFLDAGTRPVVFTLGSAAVHAAGDFFHVSAATAHRLRIRAILISPRADVHLLAAPNILVVPYADYHMLFPHAAAVVHQGGIGTTAEVLRSGVPSLIIPFNFDQPDNAARAVRQRIAVSLPRRKYNRRHSYYALRSLLRDEAIRLRAEKIGEEIRMEDGIHKAVNCIEAFHRG